MIRCNTDPIRKGFYDCGEHPTERCPNCGLALTIITKMDNIGRPFYRLWCPRCKLESAGMIPKLGRIISQHQAARWAMAVRARANGKCQRCGADGIHAHHIIPKWKDKGKALDPENGIYLCGKCHAEMHERDPVGLHPGLRKFLEGENHDRDMDTRKAADGDGPAKGAQPDWGLV